MNAIQLNCQPAKEGNALVFRYRVTNQGGPEAYVMHAVADATPSGEPFANEAEAVVVLGPGQIAVVGKFPAPLPADRRMARALIPLARRLAPAETFDSCLHIPMPFAETSPY